MCEKYIQKLLLINKELVVVAFIFLSVLTIMASNNCIWIHDSRVCVEANANWILLVHHPYSEASRIDFQLVENSSPDELSEQSRLTITTYDLSATNDVCIFRKEMLSEIDGAKSWAFNGWRVQSWSEKRGGRGGKNYKTIDARIAKLEEEIGIVCTISWPDLETTPIDYENKMRRVQESVISNISVTKLQM